MYRPPEDEIIGSNIAIPKSPSVAALIPIMAVVLISFLIIGLALPVLPLHVHLWRIHCRPRDRQPVRRVAAVARVGGPLRRHPGVKRAVVIGLLTAIVAGLLYVLSLYFAGAPKVAVTILLLGRALLGRAESFIITGAVSWGLVLVGAKNAGRVIAWIGMAMFAPLALGAPLGTALYSAAVSPVSQSRRR